MALGMAPEMEMAWKKIGSHCRIFSTTRCNGILCWTEVDGEVRTKTAPSAVNKMGMDHSCKGFPMPRYHHNHHLRWCAITDGWPEAGGVFLGKKSGDGSRYCSFFLYCLQWDISISKDFTNVDSLLFFLKNQQGSSAASSAKWVILAASNDQTAARKPKTTTDT